MMKDDRMISILTGIVLMLGIGVVAQKPELLESLLGGEAEDLVLIDDEVFADAGVLVRVDVLANDRGLPGEARDGLRLIEAPECGKLFVQDGALQFIADEACSGVQTVRYTIAADEAQSGTVKIFVQRRAPAMVPVAQVAEGGGAEAPAPLHVAPEQPGHDVSDISGLAPEVLPQLGGDGGAGEIARAPEHLSEEAPKQPERVTIPIFSSDYAQARSFDEGNVIDPALSEAGDVGAEVVPSDAAAAEVAELVDIEPSVPSFEPNVPGQATVDPQAHVPGHEPDALPGVVLPTQSLELPAARDASPGDLPQQPGTDTIGVVASLDPEHAVEAGLPTLGAAPQPPLAVGEDPAEPRIAALPGATDGLTGATDGDPLALATEPRLVTPGAPLPSGAIGDDPLAALDQPAAIDLPAATETLAAPQAVGLGVSRGVTVLEDPLARATEPRPEAPVLPRVAALAPAGHDVAAVNALAAVRLAPVAEAPVQGRVLGTGRNARTEALEDPLALASEPKPALPRLPEATAGAVPALVATPPADQRPTLASIAPAQPVAAARGTARRSVVGGAVAGEGSDPLEYALEPNWRAPGDIAAAQPGDVSLTVASLQPADGLAGVLVAPEFDQPARGAAPGAVDRRLAALPRAETVCTTQPAFRVLQQGAAINTVAIEAPCQAGGRAVLQYEGLAIGAPIGTDGRATIVVPGIQPNSQAKLAFDDGTTMPLELSFGELRRVQRLVLAWDAPVEFGLHAFESGARVPGDPGHVSLAEPRSLREVRVTGGGFITRVEAVGPGTQNLIVYTLWQSRNGPRGVVRMELDFVSRRLAAGADACGANPSASPEFRVVVTNAGVREPESRSRVQSVDCAETDALAEKFVENALPNLVISRR